MVPKPRYYDKVRYTPLLERRTWIILDRMNDVQVP
jgi:membrane peptidoglycan carboxypeptidase